MNHEEAKIKARLEEVLESIFCPVGGGWSLHGGHYEYCENNLKQLELALHNYPQTYAPAADGPTNDRYVRPPEIYHTVQADYCALGATTRDLGGRPIRPPSGNPGLAGAISQVTVIQ